jgi:hypothetical protein
MNYYSFVSEPRFFEFLLEIDRSIAIAAHGVPCQHCGGKLDQADFHRTGYGIPDEAPAEVRRRFSFSCRVDGCRRRKTPDSVRFIRGMAYAAIVIVLAAAVHHGLTPDRVTAIRQKLNVSRQTVSLWIKWWRDQFAASPFWRKARGLFMPPLDEAKLPLELMNYYATNDNKTGEPSARSVVKFIAAYPL